MNEPAGISKRDGSRVARRDHAIVPAVSQDVDVIELPYVIAIGASAGGIEAFERVFKEMPKDLAAPIVIIQHFAKDFVADFEQRLSDAIDMDVRMIIDGMPLAPNVVFVSPPGYFVELENRRLCLKDRQQQISVYHPINTFFQSIAQQVGAMSIGVVLSGAGSDGTQGGLAIADQNGLVIAQEPSSCRFSAMPQNLVSSGAASITLPPESIGPALERYLRFGESIEAIKDVRLSTTTKTGLPLVYEKLKCSHGVDFHRYKQKTIERRIQRRMCLTGFDSIERYAENLLFDDEETAMLFRDLLIDVTNFFRDIEAFERLRQIILPDLFRFDESEEIFRVWVCACASGEEAYSIAILIEELIREHDLNLKYQIFATDVHRDSIIRGDVGTYAAGQLDGLSEECRERYFHCEGGNYSVVEWIRRRIIFTTHDVLSMAPFAHIDLISCRNMLIYLNRNAQQRCLGSFYYALRPAGILFLGPSESANDYGKEFESLDKRWKIFRRRERDTAPLQLRDQLFDKLAAGQPSSAIKSTSLAPEKLFALYDSLLSEMLPPSVLTSEKLDVLHTFPGAEAFLHIPAGRLSTNLMELIDEQFKSSLQAAVRHAIEHNVVTNYDACTSSGPNEDTVRIIVHPIGLPAYSERHLLIHFDVAARNERETFTAETAAPAMVRHIENLEDDLGHSRQNLQVTVDDLHRINNELQVVNDDLIVANEKLQSANEELQSVNEELYSLNGENERQIEKLRRVKLDLDNLLQTTGKGAVFLDLDLDVRFVSRIAAELLSMSATDQMFGLELLRNRLGCPRLHEFILAARDNATKETFEASVDGRCLEVEIAPYRSGDVIDGVTLLISDQ
ncbi:chemotaxis protein CheB [Roseiconus lacunae]|uniref:Chemotaxis protein CheB n=1 Tax=Roseiconus lacunae TaxID=2605694 RepID=A0ABT7PL76_9BACT|nr:chemotaxis protein CheB [Roseiconus lacunae]MDM4017223.1 chemotaxis protein CheB [Roseiconus lacunae]